MKKTTRKSPAPLPSFEAGQIWQIGDTNLQIGLVGKRLVHYKHYKAQAKRPSTQLLGKTALETFLQKNRAVLLPEAASPNVPAPAAPAVPATTVARRAATTRRKPARTTAAIKSI
jgi:hypothetical protein